MRLVKPMAKYFFSCFIILSVSIIAYSQENSPFSRYGLGDIYPQQSIASRGMAGLSAAFSSNQAINSMNPASYGSLGIVTYDFALSIDMRSLRSATPNAKYKSTNFIPSYLQLGIPLTKKRNGAALVFGLRPYTRINYSVSDGDRIDYDSLGITDSIQQLYEGNGSVNQVFAGIGKTWRSKKNPLNSFSLGVNGGYEWGAKYTGTKIAFPLDSLNENWYKSNSTDTTHYWGVFLNPGFMASFTLKEKTDEITKLKHSYVLVIGASGTLEQNLNANRDFTRETFFYKDDGSIQAIDSVYRETAIPGKVNIPLSMNGGIMLNRWVTNGPYQLKQWGIGVEYNFSPWSKYLFYGLPDKVRDSWFIRGGLELTPSPMSNKSILSTGTYRLGYYRGVDYIDADGNGYKVQAFTFGYSFNLRKYRSYDNQFTMINTAIEVGKRGSNVNNVTENFFKISLGLSLSDVWFIKRKYD